MDDKIQQYVLLAKGARGRAVVDLIGKATSEVGIFGFGELLACPSVQDLAAGDLAPHLELLQLFAYGTWQDYKGAATRLPPLNDAQQLKLKQLTVISLALVEKVIAYDKLQAQLNIGSVRELEDFLITQCFYASILKAKLDQSQRSLQVRNVIGRDVRPEDASLVAEKLATWITTCEAVLGGIESTISSSAAATEVVKAHKAAVAACAEDVRSSLKASDFRSGEGLMGMLGGLDDMDSAMMDEDGRPELMLLRGDRFEERHAGGGRGDRHTGRPKSSRRR